jgi:hypothetical protein
LTQEKDSFESLFKGMRAACAGLVQTSLLSRYMTRRKKIIGEDIHELKKSWMKPFGALI